MRKLLLLIVLATGIHTISYAQLIACSEAYKMESWDIHPVTRKFELTKTVTVNWDVCATTTVMEFSNRSRLYLLELESSDVNELQQIYRYRALDTDGKQPEVIVISNPTELVYVIKYPEMQWSIYCSKKIYYKRGKL